MVVIILIASCAYSCRALPARFANRVALLTQQRFAIASPHPAKRDRTTVVFIRLPVVLKSPQYPVRRGEFARFQCNHQKINKKSSASQIP